MNAAPTVGNAAKRVPRGLLAMGVMALGNMELARRTPALEPQHVVRVRVRVGAVIRVAVGGVLVVLARGDLFLRRGLEEVAGGQLAVGGLDIVECCPVRRLPCRRDLLRMLSEEGFGHFPLRPVHEYVRP